MSDLAQTLSWSRNETELVSKLQAGSDTAFEWLVTYYHASVYNVIYGILGDRNTAADVTQEVFLKVFRGIRGFRRGSSLKTWLYRIAVRESLNHRRWWRRHCRNEVSIDAPAKENQPATEIEDLEATPFEQLAQREIQTAVRNALSELPEAYRSAVILRDLEGLSYEEVAEVLEISIATVKTRILRGRRALKKVLDSLLHAPHPPALENVPPKAHEQPAADSEWPARIVAPPHAAGSEVSRAGSYAAMSMSRGRGGWQ